MVAVLEAVMTPKQEQFVREYLIDLNGAQAAIRCGYSPKAAKEQASRLLTNANVAAAVAKAQAERAAKCDVDAAWVLREAKRTYEACHAADKLSEAVSALKLVGSHIDVQAFKERTAQEHTGKDGGPILLEQAAHDATTFRSRLLPSPTPGTAAGGTGEA